MGDRVLAFTSLGLGTHAEYRCMAETSRVENMGWLLSSRAT